MTERPYLIAGNWKMHGLRQEGLDLARAVAERAHGALTGRVDLLVCPPATILGPVCDALADTPVAVGGQDCHPEPKGAHTGDVAAEMLADLGASHVIVGHSERRQNHGERSALIRAKAAAALRAGMTAIVCVGETREERDAGEAASVVSRQVLGSVPPGATSANCVLAYEPVWAIGTGLTPTLDDIAAMHAMIRDRLSEVMADHDQVRLLYGGSVKPANAAEILALADVDGALIGGASLDADSFWSIAQACR